MFEERKIKLRDGVKYYNRLENFNIKGVKINYSLLLIKKQLSDQMEILREIAKPSEENIEYIRKKIELAKKYEDPNNGLPINIEGIMVKIDPEKIYELERDFKQLDKEYESVVEKRKQKNSEIEKILDNEITIKVFPLSMKDIPEDIPTHLFEILVDLDIIKDIEN